MIDNIIFVPYKRRKDELYKFVVFGLNKSDEDFYSELNDTENKYRGPDKISKDAVKQILNEFGLTTISDLLDSTDNIDFNTIASYAAYLSLLKGSRLGYETTIKLLGFDYIMQEWWEQLPKGKPNTFSMDILIDSSIVPEPYETFQKIKRFTAEYVFPVIDPLAYTMSVNFAELYFLHCGFAHPTYNGSIETSLDDALLFSKTKYILQSPDGTMWNLKVNNLGELRTFKTTVGNVTRLFSLERPTTGRAIIQVDDDGNIFAIDTSPSTLSLLEFSIVSRNGTLWFFNIDDDNNVTVSQ